MLLTTGVAGRLAGPAIPLTRTFGRPTYAPLRFAPNPAVSHVGQLQDAIACISMPHPSPCDPLPSAHGLAQVKNLNDAIALFTMSDVIPYHYVIFTTIAMIGLVTVFQETEIRTDDGGCTMGWTFLSSSMA